MATSRFLWSKNFWAGILPGIWGLVAGIVAAKIADLVNGEPVRFTPDEAQIVWSAMTGLGVWAVAQFNNWRKHHPLAQAWGLNDFWGLWPAAAFLVCASFFGVGCDTLSHWTPQDWATLARIATDFWSDYQAAEDAVDQADEELAQQRKAVAVSIGAGVAYYRFGDFAEGATDEERLRASATYARDVCMTVFGLDLDEAVQRVVAEYLDPSERPDTLAIIMALINERLKPDAP